MPRAFPYPITIGTDICQISRIYTILTKGDSQYTKLFQKRILTLREQTVHADRLKALRIYVHKLSQIEGVSKQPPTGISNEIIRSVQGLRSTGKDQLLQEMGSSLDDVAVFLAGRFAAKEAVIKAHRMRRLTFHEISIISPKAKDGSSLPLITTIAAKRPSEPDQYVPVSISHDGDYATATCLACEEPTPIPNPIPEPEPVRGDDYEIANILEAEELADEDPTPIPEPVSVAKLTPGVGKKSTGGKKVVGGEKPAGDKKPPGSKKAAGGKKTAGGKKPADAPRDDTDDRLPDGGGVYRDDTYLSAEEKEMLDMEFLDEKDSRLEEMLSGADEILEDDEWDEAFSEEDADPENERMLGDEERSLESADPSGNPTSLRPPMTEEERVRRENRLAKLSDRKESIYGLPPTVDPKAIKRIKEAAARVLKVPVDTTSQDLVDLFKGRCSVKGYVERLSDTHARGFLVFQYSKDLKKAMKETKFGEYTLGGKTVSIHPALEFVKTVLTIYARALKKEPQPLRGLELHQMRSVRMDWDMRPKDVWNAVNGGKGTQLNLGEFWSTDIYHVQEGAANNIEP